MYHRLVQIDAGVGQVIGVTQNDYVFALLGSYWSFLGRLKQVTVGPAGTWGVNRENRIFKLVAANFVEVPGQLLKQIDAGGDQIVAGVNDLDFPFCLDMDSTVSYSGPHSPVNWVDLDGSLKQYSCGPYSCWGVNSQDQIFLKKGVNSSHCQGVSNWQHIPGSLSMIDVGGDGSVYGVNSNGDVYRRDFVTDCKPEGNGWSQIPLFSGQVEQVSYDTGHLWIILKNGVIHDCPV
ncbi:fish-egg lectin-like [Sardina pilchardus]|uniref:fish-egg lectin-like n=1 Tax=Sardina pilchardus TaxID=27697 RepID=UPI002E107DFC